MTFAKLVKDEFRENKTVTLGQLYDTLSANSDVSLITEGQSVTLVYVDSTQGWVNTMDSTSNVRGTTSLVASVSGACNTLATAPDCGDVKVATFLGPGTFTVCSISLTAPENTVGTLSSWKQAHEAKGNECTFITLYRSKHKYDPGICMNLPLVNTSFWYLRGRHRYYQIFRGELGD